MLVYNDGIGIAEIWGAGKKNRNPIVLTSDHSVCPDDLTIVLIRVYPKGKNPQSIIRAKNHNHDN